MMKTCVYAMTAMAIAVATTAQAATVTDWRTYRGTAATVLAGQGTDAPTVGNLAGATANQSFLIGKLDTPVVVGPSAGDFVRLAFNVRFNDTTGMGQGGDNLRFALFDLNGETLDSTTGGVSGSANYNTAGTDNTDNFRGYWYGVKTGTGTGGSIRERNAMLGGTENNAFTNTGANTLLTPVGGSDVALVSDVNGNDAGSDYLGVMTLTRNAMGGIDLSGLFKDIDVATGNVFSFSDSTPAASTYGAVGFLFGNGLGVEQAIFSNVRVNVPEPASVLMLIGGIACLSPGRIFGVINITKGDGTVPSGFSTTEAVSL